jgi:hypothetical protein
MRWCVALAMLLALFPSLAAASAVPGSRTAYAPSGVGHLAGYRLAGIEPDGDPIDQALLKVRLGPSRGIPSMNLIVDAYLENFKPDTTPVLPDLLHQNRVAHNLGGFLQGKALLTDDSGQVLYVGSFLAEAFLDNSNHAVLSLDGTGAGRGGTAVLAGTFRLAKDASFSGSFTGHVRMPSRAQQQILKTRGKRMRSLKQIIKVVTVRPAPMMGRATKGTAGAPLHTAFAHAKHRAVPTRHVSPFTIIAGLGAIVSFVIALVLWRAERRRLTEKQAVAP